MPIEANGIPLEYLTHLPRLTQALAALSEARGVDEVKGIRDKALAMRLYAHQAKDSTLEQDAAEIRLRAERRAGEMLREQMDRGELAKQGVRGPGKKASNQSSKRKDDYAGGSIERPMTLADISVSRKESAAWQKLAEVPKPVFEQAIKEARDKHKPVTVNHVLKAQVSPRPTTGSTERDVLTHWVRLKAQIVKLTEECSSSECKSLVMYLRRLADAIDDANRAVTEENQMSRQIVPDS